MVNILQEGDNGLVNLDYRDLLKKILQLLQSSESNNLFALSEDQKRLIINIDEIAYQIAMQKIDNPLVNLSTKAKSATVNFIPETENYFNQKIKDIRDCLKEKLEIVLKSKNPEQTLENFLKNLATELTNFQGKIDGNKLSFNYPFTTYQNLQKQQLSFTQNDFSKSPLLKFHRLVITVDQLNDFEDNLKASLSNWIETFEESQQEDLNDILSDLVNDKHKKSDFYKLLTLVREEALGRLQREARVKYLEYLFEHLSEHPDNIYLEDLIRRLRLIETYINDTNKEDGFYEVNYEGITVNYRELFNRADAFDYLPIISEIAGYLGELKDENKGKKQFIFGMKLKLAGKYQAEKMDIFDYRLSFLDVDSKIYQEGLKDPFRKKSFIEKVLKTAFLYYFVFASNPNQENYTPELDLEYDPITTFNDKILPILQGSNENAKQRRLRGIKTGLETYNVKGKIAKLKATLTKLIKKTSLLLARSYTKHISIKKTILEEEYKEINNKNSFFEDDLRENPKKALKYISIDDPTVDKDSLCSLPATITINDLQYFTTAEKETFSMEYDLRVLKTIPIIVRSKDNKCREIYEQGFKQQNLLLFPYDQIRLRQQIFTENNPKTFIYQITFNLLAYTILKLLFDILKDAKIRLFIPILRFHLGDKQNPASEEVFIRSTFNVISHLLNDFHCCNSQGFCIKSINQYKINNGLNSLYSILPKKFRFNNYNSNLDKLAIIVISSRESDRAWNTDYKIANIYGEIIAIHQDKDNSIRLYNKSTFSDNYDSNNIHIHPSVVIDEVNKLYQEGFKHILYIAKSPYSTNLNMTTKNEDEELYFMSPSIIKAFTENKLDLNIYPIFFDKYYVVKLGKQDVNSLYIKDTIELTNLVKDNKQTVVFFNLFNGLEVAKDNQYNGVISYSTLLNFYEGILDNAVISNGLIANTDLKKDLLQYLTLYHFSRYESNRNVSIKLDPYQKIIGDDSVGALSIFSHINNKVKFNSLAFLTEVKKVLNLKEE